MKTLFAFFVLILLGSCGDIAPSLPSSEEAQVLSLYENWDRESWIVGAYDDSSPQDLQLQHQNILKKIQPFLSKEGASLHLLSLYSFVKVDSIPQTSALLEIKFSSSKKDKDSFLKQYSFLKKLPHVSWVEPNLLHTPVFLETESTLKNEHWMMSIKLSEAMALMKEKNLLKRKDIVIAVVDSGVDYNHSELKNNIYIHPGETQNNVDDDQNQYYDDIHGIDATVDFMDPSSRKKAVDPMDGALDANGNSLGCYGQPRSCGHGTHIAGIITKICEHCQILPLRVTRSDTGQIPDIAQIRALNYILGLNQKKVHVVNMSYGKPFQSRALRLLVKSLENQGTIMAAASGNESTDVPSYPASYENTLSICSVGRGYGSSSFALSPFSNFGNKISICAPGYDIYSTVPGEGFENKSGTSQATPMVSGVLGLMLSVAPQTSIDIYKLKNWIFQSAQTKDENGTNFYNIELNKPYLQKIPDGSYLKLLGPGVLDASKAVCLAAGRSDCGTLIQEEAPPSVEEGCVVSSVSSAGFQGFFSSAFFWLLSLGAFFSLKRIKKS